MGLRGFSEAPLIVWLSDWNLECFLLFDPCIMPFTLNTFAKSLYEFKGGLIGSSVLIELEEFTCSPFLVRPPGYYCRRAGLDCLSIEPALFRFLMLIFEPELLTSFGLSLPLLTSFDNVGYC